MITLLLLCVINGIPTEDIDNAYRAGESGYAVKGDNIYAAGGRMNGVQDSKDIRKYNVNTKTWQIAAYLNSNVENANAVMVGSEMYILGNVGPSNETRGYVFDVDELTVKPWNLDYDISVRSSTHQMVEYKQHLFINQGSNTLYAYNLVSGKWNKWSIPVKDNTPSSSVNLFVSGNKFYMAGAKDGNFYLSTLDIVFPEKEL